MTDHGGAASPRTEAGKRQHELAWVTREYDSPRWPDQALAWGAHDPDAADCLACQGIATIEAEAAQEAPAPEGLRDEALLAADAVQAHHNGDTGHDSNDGCWPRLYGALDALPSLTWRAESRPARERTRAAAPGERGR